MKDSKKIGYGFLVKNISWLMAGRFIAKMCSLLALPIITARLSPVDYGVIALFLVEAALLEALYGFSLNSFAGRMIYKYDRRNPRLCHEYMGVTLFFIVIFSTVMLVLTLPLAHMIKDFVLKDVVFPHPFFYYVPIAYAYLSNLYGFSTNNFLTLQENKKLFMCEILEFILILPLQIIGLVWFNFSWAEIVLLQLVARGIVTVFSFVLIRKFLRFSMKRLKIFRKAIEYSLPLVPLSFMGWIQSQIDKVFLGHMHATSYVGVYSLGNKLSEAFSFFSRPVMTTINPEIAKRLDANASNLQRDITDFFTLFFQISLFIIFCISIFSKEIITLLVASEYASAFLILPLLMLAYMIGEMNGLLRLKFIHKNKPGFITLFVLLGAVFNTVMNYFLVPQFNIVGAAVATVIANILVFFVSYVLSQKLHASRYNLVFNFASMAVVCVVIFFIQKYFVISWGMEVIKLVLIGAYGIWLYRYLAETNYRFKDLKNTLFKSILVRFA